MVSENRRKIMVIEDTADIRLILQQFFQVEGYDVLGASNGLEALQQLKSGARPDLIILDLLMPVMDGFQLCDEIKRDPDLARIPRIIMTGDCATEYDKAKSLVKDVLRKPMNFRTIMETVESYFPKDSEKQQTVH